MYRLFTMNPTLLSQNPLEGKDLNRVVKDTRDSIQFLQENAAPTKAIVHEENQKTSFPFAMVGIFILIFTLVGVYIYIRKFQK